MLVQPVPELVDDAEHRRDNAVGVIPRRQADVAEIHVRREGMRRRIEPPFLVGVAEAAQNRQAKRALLIDREFAQQAAVVYGVSALRHRRNQRYPTARLGQSPPPF